jgi:uncharacterized BrkB/YihY/UPF0761 family membrane protein
VDEQSQSFLKKRRRMTQFWPVIGTLLLAGVLAFLVWMFLKKSLLVNPFEVTSRIDAGTLENSTLTLMAGMLPIVFLACFFILIVVVLFAFSAFANERRYLRIIDALLRDRDNEEVVPRIQDE